MADDVSVLIKVDRQTKERMLKMNINWSGAIRQFIKEKLERRKRNRALAVLLNDRILSSQKWHKMDTTEIIRKFRDERYGPNSRRL